MAKPFTEYVDRRGPEECWPWGGAIKDNGYGTVGGGDTPRGAERHAHRLAYIGAKGPIPPGMEIDHTCHTRALDSCPGGIACQHRRCCNPNHLEVVSHRENGHRGKSAPTSSCIHGHPRTPENVRVRPENGQRQCRVCYTEKARARRERLKGAA